MPRDHYAIERREKRKKGRRVEKDKENMIKSFQREGMKGHNHSSIALPNTSASRPSTSGLSGFAVKHLL